MTPRQDLAQEEDEKMLAKYIAKGGRKPWACVSSIFLTALLAFQAAHSAFQPNCEAFGHGAIVYGVVIVMWSLAVLHSTNAFYFPKFFRAVVKDIGFSEQMLNLICDVIVVVCMIMAGWVITSMVYLFGNMYPQYKTWLSR